MSSLVTFTGQLAGYLHGNDEKRIYIKFADLADADIKYAYKGVVRALKRVDEKIQKQIVLIPEALESESIIESGVMHS